MSEHCEKNHSVSDGKKIRGNKIEKLGKKLCSEALLTDAELGMA